MKRVNHKSDFKELVTIGDPQFFDAPFRFVYSSGRNCGETFVASRDEKGNYCNCRRVDASHVLVVFDNHGLPPGRLCVERRFYVNDSDFLDGKYRIVTNDCVGIELTCGPSDADDVPVQSTVILNAVRGENGKSAYEIAVKNGFVGTEAEWLDSMFGPEAYRNLLSQIQDAKESIDSKLGEIIGAGTEKISEVVNVADEAKSVLDSLKESIISAVQAEKNGATSSINAVKTAAETAINTAKSEVSENIEAVRSQAVSSINTTKGLAETSIANTKAEAENAIARSLSDSISAIQSKAGEYIDSITALVEGGKAGIVDLKGEAISEINSAKSEAVDTLRDLISQTDSAKESAISAINSAKETAVVEISPLVGAASASADAAHASEVSAKNSEDAARQYAEGAEGSAAASLEKVKEAANNASSAASSASVAEQKAIEAADHAANVDAALEAIKGSGDITAATVAQVAENTTAISDLGHKVGNVEICTGKSYEDFFGVGLVDIAEMGYTAVPISEREYKEF